MMPHHQVLISGVNVLEKLCWADPERRVSHLRLMFSLSGGRRPLALPDDMFRSEVDAYAAGKPFRRSTIGAEWEWLWSVLNAPEQVDDEIVEAANQYRTEKERQFRDMHEKARPHFQEALRAGLGEGITSASRLIRRFRSDEKLVRAAVADLIQASPSADLLKGRELEFLDNAAGWQCFFLANAAVIYSRGIRAQNYGHKRSPGYFDIAQTVYLPRCHVYVTSDGPLRKVLRLVAAAMAERTHVLSYLQLREIVTRGYDPPGWQRFQDKGFRFDVTPKQPAELSLA